MRNRWKETGKKGIKAVSLVLAGVLTVNAVIELIDRHSIVAEAMQETLPGIEQLRADYYGTDEVFRILEIAPATDAAEIGFYIGGQEPFSELKGNDGKWLTVQEKLSTFSTETERKECMAKVVAQGTQILDSMIGEGEAPFTVSDYSEAAFDSAEEAEAAGYHALSLSEKDVRGYFKQNSTGAGEWSATFRAVKDNNITLDTLISGTATPYYTAQRGEAYSYAQLQELNQTAPDTMLYTFDGSYLSKAMNVKEYLQAHPSDPDAGVSGGDAGASGSTGVSGGDAAATGTAGVSGGDAQPSNAVTEYYVPAFTLTFGMPLEEVMGKAFYQIDSYAPSEHGNFDLIVTENEGTDAKPGITCKIAAQTIYYKGGIESNSEVFRRTVLGLDSVEECADFKIEVVTLTPGEMNRMYGNGTLTEEYLQQFSLLYYNTSTLRRDARGEKYSYQEDFNGNLLELLAGYVTRTEMPVILECSEVFHAVGNNPNYVEPIKDYPYSNRQKLLLLLLSRNKDPFFKDSNYTALTDSFKATTYFDWNLYNADSSQGGILSDDKDSKGTFDLYFVKDNVLCYYGATDPFIRKGFSGYQYGEVLLSGGFQCVYDELVSENQFRKGDQSYAGRPQLSTKVTDGAVVRHVLNYPKRRRTIAKTEINVLEIEPATANKNLSESTVKKWMGLVQDTDAYRNTKVNITCMPITEFIGIIDDLNVAYDLVYIGDSTDGLNYDSNAKTTKYNDSNMNGLLYSHVGDYVYETVNLSGLLSTDYDDNKKYYAETLHRFSGNDLTVEKYNALLEYVDAYYPVVVADSLVSDTQQKVTAVNAGKIDNSSYLYEFLQFGFGLTGDKKAKDNVFRVGSLTNSSGTVNSLFVFSINKPKIELLNFEVLNTKDYVLKATSNLQEVKNENIRVLSKNNDGIYQLTYRFQIANTGAASGNSSYRCRVFLDANADGKFSETNEELSNLTITTDDGTIVDASKLQVGVTYTISRTLSDSYNGCVTWQVKVEQNDNKAVHVLKKGYLRLDIDKAATIKILQVYFHNNRDANIILQDQIGTWNSNTLTYDNYKDSSFHKLAVQTLSEYQLDITSISRSDFEKYLKDGTYTDSKGIVHGKDWLDSMDMLIVGFSDAYNGSADNDWSLAATNAIKEFAQSGRSVLLAHDMTSVANIPMESVDPDYKGAPMYTNKNVPGIYNNNLGIDEWYWGYMLNKRMRDVLGMDTFGVTDSSKQTTAPPDKDSNGRYKYNVKDAAWAPRSNRASVVAQIQGFTYPVLMTRDSYNSKNTYKYRSNISNYTHNGRDGDRVPKTWSAVKVNEGQITNYPYIVGDNISVAETHYQYYTLDMNADSDNDSQTDMVVWYTMSGNNNSLYGSVKDVRNMYYIYSKGNVVYTGMGHSTGVTEDEAKLFLNTMIASYQSGKKSPEIQLQDASGTMQTTIYHYYDLDLEETESEQRVYFSVSDMNMTSGQKTLELEFYLENPDGVDINAETKAQKYDFQIYHADGTAVTSTESLSPGTRYMIRIPTSYLKQSDKLGNAVNIYVRARTIMKFTGIITGKEQISQSPWQVGTVKYMNCQLFNLD